MKSVITRVDVDFLGAGDHRCAIDTNLVTELDTGIK